MRLTLISFHCVFSKGKRKAFINVQTKRKGLLANFRSALISHKAQNFVTVMCLYTPRKRAH